MRWVIAICILALVSCGGDLRKINFLEKNQNHDFSDFDKSAEELNKTLEPDLCALPQPKERPAIVYTMKNGKCVGEYQS